MTPLVGGISSGARALPDLDGQRFQVARAEGAHIRDTSGKLYIDTALGFGAAFLGHGPPAVAEAVIAAIADGPMPAFAHAREEAAASALAACTGKLERVILVSSGSEAVQLACKAARAATGRRKIVKLAAGYDGWFDEIAFGGVLSPEAEMRTNHRPTRGDTLLLRYHDFADADLLFAENDDIAAVVLEPMMANAGCLTPDPAWLRHVALAAKANGAMLIADEVLTGFRFHAGLASHLAGVEPDYAALGKSIGSGFAVAALVGTPEAMRVFEDGRASRAGTYNGNAVASAAVTATMRELAMLDYGALAARGDGLRGAITSSFASAGLEVCTTGHGTVFTLWRGSRQPVTYAEALARNSTPFNTALHVALRREGVLTMHGDFGRIYLSAAHDEMIVDEMKRAFRRVADGMAAAV